MGVLVDSNKVASSDPGTVPNTRNRFLHTPGVKESQESKGRVHFFPYSSATTPRMLRTQSPNMSRRSPVVPAHTRGERIAGKAGTGALHPPLLSHRPVPEPAQHAPHSVLKNTSTRSPVVEEGKVPWPRRVPSSACERKEAKA